MVQFELRATPLDNKTPSPGKLLYNRQMKMTLTVNIKPPHSSEAIGASLPSKARLQYI